jgi:ankyrin repeat protein
MVKELLKRGASVDLPCDLGVTALVMEAGYGGHLSILLVLLQHSADPDLQDIGGKTALMYAAHKRQHACVKALLRAKANTELLDIDGRTALQRAEAKGHSATAALIRQHAAPAAACRRRACRPTGRWRA